MGVRMSYFVSHSVSKIHIKCTVTKAIRKSSVHMETSMKLADAVVLMVHVLTLTLSSSSSSLSSSAATSVRLINGESRSLRRSEFGEGPCVVRETDVVDDESRTRK